MVIKLLGEPKSTNHIYKSTCRGKFASVYMSADGKALKESYQWQAKAQWKEKPIEGEVYVGIKLFFGVNRKHDIDNYGKILLDSLTNIVWEDDSQIAKMVIEKFKDKENPRIEISAYPYAPNYGKF